MDIKLDTLLGFLRLIPLEDGRSQLSKENLNDFQYSIAHAFANAPTKLSVENALSAIKNAVDTVNEETLRKYENTMLSTVRQEETSRINADENLLNLINRFQGVFDSLETLNEISGRKEDYAIVIQKKDEQEDTGEELANVAVATECSPYAPNYLRIQFMNGPMKNNISYAAVQINDVYVNVQEFVPLGEFGTMLILHYPGLNLQTSDYIVKITFHMHTGDTLTAELNVKKGAWDGKSTGGASTEVQKEFASFFFWSEKDNAWVTSGSGVFPLVEDLEKVKQDLIDEITQQKADINTLQLNLNTANSKIDTEIGNRTHELSILRADMNRTIVDRDIKDALLQTQIDNNSVKLNALQGAYVFRFTTTQKFNENDQTTMLNTFISNMETTPSLGDVFIDGNDVEWYFNGEKFSNMGQAIVSNATNTVYGLVKGDSSGALGTVSISNGSIHVAGVGAIATSLSYMDIYIQEARSDASSALALIDIEKTARIAADTTMSQTLNNKQEKLIAGDNISIVDNVISSEDFSITKQKIEDVGAITGTMKFWPNGQSATSIYIGSYVPERGVYDSKNIDNSIFIATRPNTMISYGVITGYSATDFISIGNSIQGVTNYGVYIGHSISAGYTNNTISGATVAIGTGLYTSEESITIGTRVYAHNSRTILIGNNIYASGGDCMAIVSNNPGTSTHIGYKDVIIGSNLFLGTGAISCRTIIGSDIYTSGQGFLTIIGTNQSSSLSGYSGYSITAVGACNNFGGAGNIVVGMYNSLPASSSMTDGSIVIGNCAYSTCLSSINIGSCIKQSMSSSGTTINMGNNIIHPYPCRGIYIGTNISSGGSNAINIGDYTFVHGSAKNSIVIGYSSRIEGGDNSIVIGYGLSVNTSDTILIGGPSATLYTYNSPMVISDARDKTNVEDENLGLDFIKGLKPRVYNMDFRDSYFEEIDEEYEEDVVETIETPIYKEIEVNELDEDGNEVKILKQIIIGYDKEEKTVKETRTRKKKVPLPRDGTKAGSRPHHGLIAQEVKQYLDSLSIDSAMLVDLGHNGQIDDKMGIRYEELIAPMIKAIQELSNEVEILKGKIHL